ncbi:MAG: amino acid ABC transporter permease [Pseudomonadota bacterium]
MKDFFSELFGKPEGIILFQLVEASQYTIYLSLIAFAGGGAIGAVVTFLRLVPARGVRLAADAYVWLFQSVPLLMLLFLSGLGVPRLFGIDVNPWMAAIVSLTLHASAFMADVWRGALESVPRAQTEGARALGLGYVATLRLVILPQALRVATAPTVSFMVQIIKGTSLAYIIGFHDLMAIGKRWANATVPGSEPFIIFPLMAVIYFALCYPLTLWSRHLEARLGTTARDAKAKVTMA